MHSRILISLMSEFVREKKTVYNLCEVNCVWFSKEPHDFDRIPVNIDWIEQNGLETPLNVSANSCTPFTSAAFNHSIWFVMRAFVIIGQLMNGQFIVIYWSGHIHVINTSLIAFPFDSMNCNLVSVCARKCVNSIQIKRWYFKAMRVAVFTNVPSLFRTHTHIEGKAGSRFSFAQPKWISL